jgi:type IX secretion system PorP/SprF family membrane protein
MKKQSLILFLVLSVAAASAQQIGMYGHAFFKPMVYNPAYTGNDESINAMIISRAQWTGFKGSPELNIFTLDGNISDKKIGLGLGMISDRKGITNRIGGNVNYSYRLNINDNAYMRLGVSVGVIDQTIDYSKALVQDASDPMIFGESQRKTTFDANAGIAFFWKGLELGAAVPQLMGNKIEYADNTQIRARYTQSRHFMGTLKYRIALNKDKNIFVTPFILTRYVPGAPFQYDGTVNLELKDKLWLGATYKSDYAVTAHAGFCVHKQLYVGYAYDIILGDVSKYSGISHELMVNFKFGKMKKDDAEEKLLAEKIRLRDEEYNNKLDSLGEVVKKNQERIAEDRRKIEELNEKLKVGEKATSAESLPVPAKETIVPEPSKEIKTAPVTEKVVSSPAVTDNKSKTVPPAEKTAPVQEPADDNIKAVSNSAKDYKDGNGKTPREGFYIIGGTFIYRDFAQAEIKRFINKGYSGTNLLFSEKKEFNYIYLLRTDTREQALAKTASIRAGGIKDAWILELTK